MLPSEGRKLAQLRSDVGMVFQSFNLFAHKTIVENVMLAPIKVRKIDKDQARAQAMSLLEQVGGPARPTSTPLSFPAASSNGWPSPGPWPWHPR